MSGCAEAVALTDLVTGFAAFAALRVGRVGDVLFIGEEGIIFSCKWQYHFEFT
jgi:hypothetical protein